MAVTTMLKENLPAIMDTKFTAMMEEDLDKIAQGSLERDTLLKSFHVTFEKNLEEFKGQAKNRLNLLILIVRNAPRIN